MGGSALGELGLGGCQSQDKWCYDLVCVLKLMRHSTGVALRYVSMQFSGNKAFVPFAVKTKASFIQVLSKRQDMELCNKTGGFL